MDTSKGSLPMLRLYTFVRVALFADIPVYLYFAHIKLHDTAYNQESHLLK